MNDEQRRMSVFPAHPEQTGPFVGNPALSIARLAPTHRARDALSSTRIVAGTMFPQA
jgi:hypothetical protein